MLYILLFGIWIYEKINFLLSLLSIPVCLSVLLSVCLSDCLSVCLSFSLSVCLTVCLSIYLSNYLSNFLFTSLPLYLPQPLPHSSPSFPSYPSHTIQIYRSHLGPRYRKMKRLMTWHQRICTKIMMRSWTLDWDPRIKDRHRLHLLLRRVLLCQVINS